jgi:hypothetical protein
VLARGVVEDQVDAQRDVTLVQIRDERLQVGHGADPRIHRAVVLDRVAAVVIPVAGPQQRHQVQVADTEIGQVVEMLADTRQGAREPVGVTDVADHAGPLEPRGIDLAAAVEQAQLHRPPGRRRQRVEHQLGHEPGHVDDIAVDLPERLDDVERQLLEAGQERIGLLEPETQPDCPFRHRI